MKYLLLASLLYSVTCNASDIRYYENKGLKITLTDEPCHNINGNKSRANYKNYQPLTGCYMEKDGLIYIIWVDKTTSLFTITDFTNYLGV